MTDQHTSAKATASPPTDAGEQVKELRELASISESPAGGACRDEAALLRSAAATIEQKDTEIKILVDLLKRGFELSNREGWEEGENKTEWQSIASDAIATYDEKFRDSGLRSMESLVALERQQGATIERLTADLAAAKAKNDQITKEALQLILKETNTTIEDAEANGGTPFEILRRAIAERDAAVKVIEAIVEETDNTESSEEESLRKCETLARDFLSKQEGK